MKNIGGTIKNRMSELRWWAEKIQKQNVIARDNAQYDIPRRQYVTNVSQSRELTGGDLAKVTDPYTALSLKLQAAFGLRREESIKIVPDWADRGALLVLKASWTKRGRQREIPVRNAQQRQLLDEAKALAGRGSLIPTTMSYVQQLQRFKSQCRDAGIQHVHGHRPPVRQTRLPGADRLAGPADGGPIQKCFRPGRRCWIGRHGCDQRRAGPWS